MKRDDTLLHVSLSKHACLTLQGINGVRTMTADYLVLAFGGSRHVTQLLLGSH